MVWLVPEEEASRFQLHLWVDIKWKAACLGLQAGTEKSHRRMATFPVSEALHFSIENDFTAPSVFIVVPRGLLLGNAEILGTRSGLCA